ncbi:alpha-ketoglutarate-dependent dioxygenase AlkB [Nonomuraea jabiensis]|uniref:alpha-ketoglutarate-dependent dioxygenase AlkB n=1 Tax=Nonomuraea jabiensis TaxID=882448 RepID=UPI003424AF20
MAGPASGLARTMVRVRDIGRSTLQPPLFLESDPAVEEPGFDPTFAATRRVRLDATSWVEHVPGWLRGSRQLLGSLLAKAGWEQRDRWMFDKKFVEPRLTAEYTDLAEVPEPLLLAITAALSEHYGVPYDGLWVNLYRDHRDSTGWHGDWQTCRREECVVPVLSLGATRRFLLKPRTGGRSVALTPAGGDLVVMGGRCQRDWRHCVPKQAAPAGVRISVNFSSRLQATRA